MRDAKSELTVSESEKEAMRLQYKKSLDRRETEKEQLEFQVTPIILEFLFFLSLFFFPFFSFSSFIFYLFWYYKFIMTFNDKGPFISLHNVLEWWKIQNERLRRQLGNFMKKSPMNLW